MQARLKQPGARGFTLIEILVALVVLAVGMLGIAALYVESLRAGRTSINRITAVTLAADMADRIQANPNAAASYAGAGPGMDRDCVNGAVACTPAELADDDWFRWLQDVSAQLPGAPARRGRGADRRWPPESLHVRRAVRSPHGAPVFER